LRQAARVFSSSVADATKGSHSGGRESGAHQHQAASTKVTSAFLLKRAHQSVRIPGQYVMPDARNDITRGKTGDLQKYLSNDQKAMFHDVPYDLLSGITSLS
jgi:hypothetical protein